MKKLFWLGLPLALGLFFITKLKGSHPKSTSPNLLLQALDTQELGPIRQLTSNETGQVFVITESGQLWLLGQDKPLAEDLSLRLPRQLATVGWQPPTGMVTSWFGPQTSSTALLFP